jgi:hypothetical protein
VEAAEPEPDVLGWRQTGYLVGDRLVPDCWDEVELEKAERVWFLEEDLERFTRVVVGSAAPTSAMVFAELAMPLGPEGEVQAAYEDRLGSLDAIKNVTPALELAWRMEHDRRAEVERRRIEEAERRAKEERQRQLREQLGDGALRRAVAQEDFEEAAKAALLVGGGVYLDHRRGRPGEMVVRYRVATRRLECVCDARTLRVVDAGICLTDHRSGEKGDRYFTLESLPAVVQEAINRNKLVVWRHV